MAAALLSDQITTIAVEFYLVAGQQAADGSAWARLAGEG
jgi:hypothetical protein